ncbi:MAG: hypothetical protein ACRC62_26065 [Microcoleus sp.]
MITTGRLFAAAIGLLVLGNGENIRLSIEKGNQQKVAQTAHSDRVKQNRQEAREAQDLSKVALERAKNCILIVDKATGKDGYLTEGQAVIDTTLSRPVRPKANVCSRLGDTGITDQNGAIADLARVNESDMPAYKKLLKIK